MEHIRVMNAARYTVRMEFQRTIGQIMVRALDIIKKEQAQEQPGIREEQLHLITGLNRGVLE